MSATMPAVSVVIASNRSWELLEACLASLRPQVQALAGELVVARAASGQPGEAERRGLADLQLITAPPGTGIPRLRGLGLQAARGELVALTEDHCVAAPDWLATLMAAAPGVDAVGGGMGNARRRRAVDCAAYFSDYGFYDASRPPAEGPTLLTAANVLYSRRVLDQVARDGLAGEWENVVHDHLLAAGGRMRFVPRARVDQNMEYRLGSFCRDRYRHGLAYARRRLSERPSSRRWLLLPATLALPPLLAWRIGRAAAPRQQFDFLRSLPLTLLFLGAWSAGELMGYLRGPSGSSPRHAS